MIINKLDKLIYFFLMLFVLCLLISPIGAKHAMHIGLFLAVVRFVMEPLQINIDRKIIAAIIFFIISLLWTSFLSYAPAVSFNKAFILIDQFSIFFVTSLFIREKKHLHTILLLLCISTGVMDVAAIYEWINGKVRVSPFNSGIMGFSVYLEQITPFLAVISLEDKMLNRPTKYFALFISFLSALALVFTQTRGAWVAVAFVVGIYIFNKIITNKMLAVKLIAGLGLFVIIVLQIPSIQNRTKTIPDLNYTSTSERLMIWQESWNMFKDHSITGIGLGNFAEICRNSYLSELAKSPESHIHAHNNFLQFLVETGIIGFAGFTILFLCIFFATGAINHNESYNKWMLAVFLATLSIMLHGLTEYTFLHIYEVRIYWFLLGLSFASRSIYRNG